MCAEPKDKPDPERSAALLNTLSSGNKAEEKKELLESKEAAESAFTRFQRFLHRKLPKCFKPDVHEEQSARGQSKHRLFAEKSRMGEQEQEAGQTAILAGPPPS